MINVTCYQHLPLYMIKQTNFYTWVRRVVIIIINDEC